MQTEFYKKYVDRICEMREDGMTFRAIAEHFGVSKQSVSQIYHRHTDAPKRVRGNGFNIERIVYKGIYEHFKEDIRETKTSFAKKVYGHTAKNIQKLDKFIVGEYDTRFTIPQIKRMCEITGKTFEELFEGR